VWVRTIIPVTNFGMLSFVARVTMGQVDQGRHPRVSATRPIVFHHGRLPGVSRFHALARKNTNQLRWL